MVDSALDEYISDHFTRRECACHCGCGKYGADAVLLNNMEELRFDLRQQYGKHVVVIPTSWFRCMEHNCRSNLECNVRGIAGAGSNSSSWHPTGCAVDFKVRGVGPRAVYHYLRDMYPDRHGIGQYDTFTHFDVRPERADWDSQTHNG